MVSGSDGTVSQRRASQRLRRRCRLFAEKHAILTGADRGQARSRDGIVRMLCESSTGWVEYTKGGVPGGARCLVVGLAEGDGCAETKPEAGGRR